MKKIMKRYYFIYVVLVTLSIWAGTGTLSPYAATHLNSPLEGSCNYLVNGDHPHFEATYLFLKGEPAERWSQSVVLRRILFPLIAYPFMQASDYLRGGVVASIFLHIVAGLIFLRFLLRRYGAEALIAAAFILPTFPGITYFGGLPYSYACIVPFTLLGFIGLDALYEKKQAIRTASICGLSFGLLSIGYDLLGYLLLAGILLLALRKEWVAIIVFALSAVSVPMLNSFILSYVYDVPLLNSNTASYGNIIGAYFKIGAQPFSEWSPLLLDMPHVLLHNFFFSSFLILPATACIVFLRNLIRKQRLLTPVECAFLFAALFIWLVNNAAPPYQGWQLRGVWIARIYEPIFVVLLVFTVRSLKPREFHFDKALFLSAFLLQVWIVNAPLTGFTGYSDYLYTEFYQHNVHGAFSTNLEKYGRRPMGFCSVGQSNDIH